MIITTWTSHVRSYVRPAGGGAAEAAEEADLVSALDDGHKALDIASLVPSVHVSTANWSVVYHNFP